jgi:ribosomal protein S18 acetylase RimI-like enzyme
VSAPAEARRGTLDMPVIRPGADPYIPEVTPDRWLSGLIDRDCYKVEFDTDRLTADGLQAVLDKAGRVRSVFTYVKVPTTDIDALNCFAGAGFRVVDTLVTFGRPAAPPIELSARCAVRFADGRDQDRVTEIAGTSFGFTRFHLDPRIENAKADRIKAEWAGNFFRGARGDHMVVAETSKGVCGFLQLIAAPGGRLVIDLIAVADGQRRIGAARSMVALALRDCPGVETLVVGTQVANIESIRFYERLGFTLTSSHYVLHSHPSERQ